MNIFFLSLFVIFCAGLIPLLTYRSFTLTKSIYSSLTIFGSLLCFCSLVFGMGSPESQHLSVTWLQIFPLEFAVDSLSRFFIIPVLLIGSLAALYSLQYFTNESRALRMAISLGCTNVLLVSMIMVAAAGNMIAFALFWELMSISSFILVLYDYEKESTRKAGYLYFMFTQAGALLIFSSFAIIFSSCDSFSLSGCDAMPSGLKLLAFFLAFAGFGSKAGIFPLHIWLPYAHPAAPSHISAIMSGVMIKMGIYGILRMFFMLVPTSLAVGQVVLVFGMISGVLGVVYALGKHDIKRLLAYHSVENIGIILIGAGLGMMGSSLGNPSLAILGYSGALLHVLNHSIFKSLLFMGAGMVIKQTGESHVDNLGGLMKNMPQTGKTFLVGSVSISGLPPFNGFISEFLIYCGAFSALNESPSIFLFATFAILSLALIGGLASFCFTKVVGIVFLGEPRTAGLSKAKDGAWATVLPMVFLAVCCLLIGLFPQPFINFAAGGLRDVLNPGLFSGGPDDLLHTLGDNLALGTRIFLILCILVVAVRKLLYRDKEIGSTSTWGCGFTKPTVRMQYTGTSYARTVVGFFQPFVKVDETAVKLRRAFPGREEFSSRVDDVAEIGMQKGLAQALTGILMHFRWIQHGKIQLYIAYIVVAILVLLVALFM